MLIHAQRDCTVGRITSIILQLPFCQGVRRGSKIAPPAWFGRLLQGHRNRAFLQGQGCHLLAEPTVRVRFSLPILEDASSYPIGCMGYD